MRNLTRKHYISRKYHCMPEIQFDGFGMGSFTGLKQQHIFFSGRLQFKMETCSTVILPLY